MNPNETEMRELDRFCAKEIMGLSDDEASWFFPTRASAAAFEVLKKCGEEASKGERSVDVEFYNGRWMVSIGDFCAEAPTLELAICRFAFQLYGGKTT